MSPIQSKSQSGTTKQLSRPPFSALTMRIYVHLATYGKPMSILRIAKELDILPPTAYKAFAPLESAGLVQSVRLLAKPKFYRCYPSMQAEWQYVRKARADFAEWFAPLLSKD